MTEAARPRQPRFTPAERLVLVFGVAVNSRRFIDSAWLTSFTDGGVGGRDAIERALDRLEEAELIEIRHPGVRPRYRRTAAGHRVAMRLLADARISFWKGLSSL